MSEFKSLYKILPNDPVKWRVEDFSKFLAHIKEDKYIHLFEELSIDNSMFFDLSKDGMILF